MAYREKPTNPFATTSSRFWDFFRSPQLSLASKKDTAYNLVSGGLASLLGVSVSAMYNYKIVNATKRAMVRVHHSVPNLVGS